MLNIDPDNVVNPILREIYLRSRSIFDITEIIIEEVRSPEHLTDPLALDELFYLPYISPVAPNSDATTVGRPSTPVLEDLSSRELPEAWFYFYLTGLQLIAMRLEHTLPEYVELTTSPEEYLKLADSWVKARGEYTVLLNWSADAHSSIFEKYVDEQVELALSNVDPSDTAQVEGAEALRDLTFDNAREQMEFLRKRLVIFTRPESHSIDTVLKWTLAVQYYRASLVYLYRNSHLQSNLTPELMASIGFAAGAGQLSMIFDDSSELDDPESEATLVSGAVYMSQGSYDQFRSVSEYLQYLAGEAHEQSGTTAAPDAAGPTA